MVTCPNCSSTDIDMQRQECRSCRVGLPDGSFDVRPRYRVGRASMRASNTERNRVRSDKQTKNIAGGGQ